MSPPRRSNSTLILQTWYGLQAAVDIHRPFLHRAGFKGILVPHPPLANALLRRGLSRIARRRLATIHEFGHLQTFPLVSAYFLIATIVAARGHSFDLFHLLLLFVGAHLLWELMAEGYTRWHEQHFYPRTYGETSAVPRALFWLGVTLLFLASWAVIFLQK